MENQKEEEIINVMKELRLEDEGETLNITPSVEKVEEILGYVFKDKTLLVQAFTHHSCSSENCSSYERLEFIGDSVLNLLLAKEHYLLYPEMLPGQLTPLRAANVDTEKLARVAINHDFHKYLRHNIPDLEYQVKEFEREVSKYHLHSNGLIERPKVLADIIESMVGALFIDSNSCLDTVWKVVKVLWEPTIKPETLKVHPVTQLRQICRELGLKIRFADRWWRKTKIVNVYVQNQFAGRGKSVQRKQIARNKAAQNVLDSIVELLDKNTN